MWRKCTSLVFAGTEEMGSGSEKTLMRKELPIIHISSGA